MNFFKKIRNALLAGAAALFGAAAFADDPTPLGAAIASVTSSVNEGLAGGLTVATAVVVGLFAIWGIKLLMRGK